MTRGIGLRIPLFALALAAAPAFAASSWSPEHASKVMEGAKTTLSEAVSTAEGQVGGKALSAWLAQRHGQDFYDVRVLKGDTLTEVRVSIDDGTVMSTMPIEQAHMAKAKSTAPAKAEPPGKKG